MIQRFLKFAVRKDIDRKNKKINHVMLLQSMSFGEKIPYLARWHKKKLIAFGLALVLIYTYDLQKWIYRKIISLKSPLLFAQNFLIPEAKTPNTIIEQDYQGISLSQKTIQILSKIYAEADKELYFGVGRNLLFEIYRDLGLIEKQEEIKKFWIASGFYKERNQKASGIGIVEFFQVFEEALAHRRKKQQISEQQFLKKFVLKFIQKLSDIKQWEIKFNSERMAEFIKNMPGDNTKKQDAILDLMKQSSRQSTKLITVEEMEEKIKSMGLRGMNFTDKLLYFDINKTWLSVKLFNIEKKISHPLTTEDEKGNLFIQKEQMEGVLNEVQNSIQQIEKKYEKLYKQQIF